MISLFAAGHRGRDVWIAADPIVNFLCLLVGVAGGSIMGHGSRVWARNKTWDPLLGLVWIIGGGLASYVLIVILGLRDRTAWCPLSVGTLVSSFLYARGPRRRS